MGSILAPLHVQAQSAKSNGSDVESRAVRVTPKLADAQRKFAKANRAYEQTRRLVARGSATQAQLRRERLLKQIAELQLRAIQNPDPASRYARKSKELKSEYAKKEYEISRALYQRGSASQLAYRRKLYAYKIASVELAESNGSLDAQTSEIKIARLRLQLAEHEFRAAKRLLESGSIKRSTYEKKLEEFRAAKLTVEQLTLADT